MTTTEWDCEGGGLEVNADVRGALWVEVLDGAGRVVPGFSRGECRVVCGDELRHGVVWGGKGMQGLKGQRVRLRFGVVDGDLYAYGFRVGE